MIEQRTWKNGKVSSNLDRLKELTRIMLSDEGQANDTLLLVNDELKRTSKQLDSKKNDREKVKECKRTINYLMEEIKNCMNDNIKNGPRKEK